MSDWKKTTLGAELTFQRGFDITKKEQSPGEYWVISSSGPSSTHSEAKIKGPGVIIGRKGTLGTVFFSQEDYWPHDTTLWVKDFHGNDEKFAYYFLQTMHLEQYDAGASNPTLNRNHIHLLPISYPLPSLQRRIAAILSAYDDLIENNARRIAILEEMARNLYHEWFVELRFPGHENVRIVDGVPAGWASIPYAEILTSSTGGDWGSETPTEDEDCPVVIIRGTDFDDVIQGGALRAPTRYISKNSFAKRMLQPQDIIIENSVNASSRCTGRNLLISHGILRRLGNNAICASFCKNFKLKETKLAPLIHLHLMSLYESGKMAFYQNVAANGIGNFQAKRFIETQTVLFPKDNCLLTHLMNTFESLVATTHADKIDNLRRTRDLLLPKLISGELDVSELEIAGVDEYSENGVMQ